MKGKSSDPLLTLGAALRNGYLMTAVLVLAACGHSSSNSSSNSSTYTVGGTISGLTASTGILLVNNSSIIDTVSILPGTTSWVFPSSFAAGSSYSVSVYAQPAGELCEVTGGGTGTALTANVTNVAVVCSLYGQWTWEAGLNTVNASGVYGTRGAASASNLPGARYDSSSWTDSAGNFWLFGGVGYNSTGGTGSLNDLWQYSPSTGLWTWISGGNGDNASGVYGTLGTASAGSVPGARYSASSWIDASGNMWLFGGYGYDATGGVGRLNDLWKYSQSTGLWTWVSGGSGDNANGVYGTQGTASAGNAPGARYSASSWVDSSGNLWLFGGTGYDSTGAVGNLNDLWRYSPSTGQWAWVSGGNASNAAGVYGTLGAAAASNLPGARQAASSWIDSSGNLWLFGGYGYGSSVAATGGSGYLNDLWQYSPSTRLWTWISGGGGNNTSGVYGTQGAISAGTMPGGREAGSAWADSSGNLWLFGGYGYDSAGSLGDLNDLWQYSLSTGRWAWITGGNRDNAIGAYGGEGTISASTVPGAREAANSWIDASGHLWLFGGAGYGSTGNGYLNDLWQFVPP
jgi:N-acetylneuraminic acid mutarotase